MPSIRWDFREIGYQVCNEIFLANNECFFTEAFSKCTEHQNWTELNAYLSLGIESEFSVQFCGIYTAVVDS